MKTYILATLIAAIFLAVVLSAVATNQATTQHRREAKSGCNADTGFVNAVCHYRGGGKKKSSSSFALPSEPFQGIDTGIPYESDYY